MEMEWFSTIVSFSHSADKYCNFISMFIFVRCCSPVNDLSILMDGNVARDGHRFANAQWGYIVKKQSTSWGRFVDKHVNDSLDVPRVARVTISAFPEESAAEFPPFYTVKKIESTRLSRGPIVNAFDESYVPVITMGRYGTILKEARPSDDAFIAMFNSAKTIIRCALQDIGPICVPKTKMTVPGTFLFLFSQLGCDIGVKPLMSFSVPFLRILQHVISAMNHDQIMVMQVWSGHFRT